MPILWMPSPADPLRNRQGEGKTYYARVYFTENSLACGG